MHLFVEVMPVESLAGVPLRTTNMDNKLKFDFVELQTSTLKPVRLISSCVYESAPAVAYMLDLARSLLDDPIFKKASITHYKNGRLNYTLEGSSTLLEFNFYKDDIKL